MTVTIIREPHFPPAPENNKHFVCRCLHFSNLNSCLVLCTIQANFPFILTLRLPRGLSGGISLPMRHKKTHNLRVRLNDFPKVTHSQLIPKPGIFDVSLPQCFKFTRHQVNISQ